jgi:integrase/recombinase XerC
MTTIQQAIDTFLSNLAGNTEKAYRSDFHNGSSGFLTVMELYNVQSTSPITVLTERHGVQWVQWMWDKQNKSTIQRRISAYKNLIRFCKFKYSLNANVDQFTEMLKAAKLQPKSKNRRKVPMSKIERVVTYASLDVPTLKNEYAQLRAYRDNAFIVSLADTGLRVSEACALKRGDIMYDSQSAVIVGKGSKQAVIRFSNRSIKSLKSYLQKRSQSDGKSNKALSTLPLFARVTKNTVKPISDQTGRAIVENVSRLALGTDYVVGEITPHSLRHFFVMTALRSTGGDLKKVKELARHDAIATTELYTQIEDAELDKTYKDIFNKE